MIEICAVGGYSEIGKNMTAVRIGNDVILLDCGVLMDKYIQFTKDEALKNLNPEDMIDGNAIPDIHLVDDWRKDVKAIVITHAHLDHLGAVPLLEKYFNAQIICTPFSVEVLKTLFREEGIKDRNKIVALAPNSKIKIGSLVIEFVHITHSTPQTTIIAIHSDEGVVVYGNDFKLDNTPILGKKPNYKRLRELGDKGVDAAILDCIYSNSNKKTPSEAVARELLKEVMLGTQSDGKLMIVTTFASHIARIKSIMDLGKQMNRKILFLGRSFYKYITAAENINLVNFSREAEIAQYSSMAKKKLRQVSKEREKYLLVVTGHQGEPDAILSKMVTGRIPFKFEKGDLAIFSCNVIPTELNKRNRENIESELRVKGVRIFTDIHASGHTRREDMRDMLQIIRPKHIIPAHAPRENQLGMKSLAEEEGFNSVFMLKDGDRAEIESD